MVSLNIYIYVLLGCERLRVLKCCNAQQQDIIAILYDFGEGEGIVDWIDHVMVGFFFALGEKHTQEGRRDGVKMGHDSSPIHSHSLHTYTNIIT